MTNVHAGVEFGTLYPERYYEIRYEDLSINCSDVQRGILNLIGASEAAGINDECVTAGSFTRLAKRRSTGV